MENRARYTLMGLFVLAITAGAFIFVYWLENTGGLGKRATYIVQFDQPVSGLTPGSGVLFNGIRVGVISDIRLDTINPKRVTLTLSIDPATPVRVDTIVDVTYQGFTGAPAILLKGGSETAAPLTSQNGQPPVLTVSSGVGQNLSEAARETLHHLDEILTDNAKPLHTAITGVSTFADMLGRNSKRLEDMIGGLERLTGTGATPPSPTVYDLIAPTTFPLFKKTIDAPLIVADPSSIIAFDTQKILVRSAAGAFSNIENAQWADNLPKLLQAKIVQSFENANQLKMVSRPIDQLNAAYHLELAIRRFQILSEPKPMAEVEFSARLISDKGEVTDARIFNVSEPSKSLEASAAAAALNAAFAKAAEALVVWTVDLI
jgi:phospholipid/cholesterol/gamma-HCH transport system substrate-binding protein